jgi:hypothetical protein
MVNNKRNLYSKIVFGSYCSYPAQYFRWDFVKNPSSVNLRKKPALVSETPRFATCKEERYSDLQPLLLNSNFTRRRNVAVHPSLFPSSWPLQRPYKDLYGYDGSSNSQHSQKFACSAVAVQPYKPALFTPLGPLQRPYKDLFMYDGSSNSQHSQKFACSALSPRFFDYQNISYSNQKVYNFYATNKEAQTSLEWTLSQTAFNRFSSLVLDYKNLKQLIAVLNIWQYLLSKLNIFSNKSYAFTLYFNWIFHFQVGFNVERFVLQAYNSDNFKIVFKNDFINYQKRLSILIEVNGNLLELGTFGVTKLFYNKTNLLRLIRLLVNLYNASFWDSLPPFRRFAFCKKLIHLTLSSGTYKYLNALMEPISSVGDFQIELIVDQKIFLFDFAIVA